MLAVRQLERSHDLQPVIDYRPTPDVILFDPFQPCVRHRTHAAIWFTGTERIVFSGNTGRGQGIEYGRFTHIGESRGGESQCDDPLTYRGRPRYAASSVRSPDSRLGAPCASMR